MSSSLATLLKRTAVVLSWIPLLVFFLIIIFMFLNEFQNPVDEYFVRLVLRSCLILLAAVGLAQVGALLLLAIGYKCHLSQIWAPVRESFSFLSAFPLVETGIFSVAIFLKSPSFEEWVYLIAALLIIPAIHYWKRFFQGPMRRIYDFSRMHRIPFRRSFVVLAPYSMASFIDYFFVVLKQVLLPMVFILVVMDFRIILPRLVDAGMSYQSFIMFISLIISLHLLSYKEERA